MVGFRRHAVAPWLLSALGLGGCAELGDVQPGCGNGVVESGEDCDQKEDKADGNACGQPGKDGAGACHFICGGPGGASPKCKDGWYCGVDNICRQPATPATWTRASSQVFEGRCDELIARDFDGDNITDVAAVAPPTLTMHYFEASRSAPTLGGSLITPTTAHPSAGTLIAPSYASGNGTTAASSEVPALALSLARGLATFLGTSDRALTPAAYASVSFSGFHARVAPFLLSGGTAVSTTGFFGYTDTGIFSLIPPGDVGVFNTFAAGDVRTGDGVVAKFANLPCEQMALPFNRMNRGHVAILAPCDGNGTPLAKGNTLADVQLPMGVRTCLDSGMDAPPGMSKQRCKPLHVLDIDHNGWPDLVITADDNQMYLAFGDGSGNFGPAANVPPSNLLGAPYQTPGATHGPPLAIADLNGDCALDFVDATGIFMSNTQYQGNCPAAGYTTAASYVDVGAFLDSHYWTDARITDMNHDGALDIVVGSAFSAGITLFAGTQTQLFNPFAIVTSAGVKELSTGDFDGDGVLDLAFAEIGETAADTGFTYDTLYISYGAASGAPSEPQALAEITGVSQLLPSYEQAVSADLIRDLFVSTYEGSMTDKSTSVYLFPGDSSRQIEAPYYLVQGTGGTDVPARTVIGHFSGDPTYPDIAAFALGFACSGGTGFCGSRLWLLPTGDDGSIEPVSSKEGAVPQESATLPDELLNSADALLANLGPDGSGKDKLVIVAAGKGGTVVATAGVVDGKLKLDQQSPLPTIAKFDSSSPGGTLEGHLVTADLDGDKNVDLVILTPGKGLAVVRGTGNGTLDVAGAQVVTVDDLDLLGCPAGPSEKGKPALDAAALRAGTDGKQTLVLVKPDAAFLLGWADGKPAPTCFPSTGDYQQDVAGGFAVATGDFNGDGIEDIVVSERSGLAVYYGEAAAPLGDSADAGAGGGAQ
jgi:hypothetical protein